MKTDTFIELTGLRMAPSQTWGSIRLVPLIRNDPTVGEGLRIDRRDYGSATRSVALSHAARGPATYTAYIPYGLVFSYDPAGRPLPALGTVLGAKSVRAAREASSYMGLKRVVRKEDRRVRLLPLHAAMEGFMALHFGGPDVAHRCWSQSRLASWVETVFYGDEIKGLNDALRVFEIHEGQVGMAVFVADALASLNVVSHPDDYRMLHRALIQDFYGEVMWRYGFMNHDAPQFDLNIDGQNVSDLKGLRQAYQQASDDWDDWRADMAGGLFGRSVRAERLRRVGPYGLCRFMTRLDEGDEHHIGETIVDDDGQLLYAKTFRLDPEQVGRARILSVLAENEWHPGRAAKAIGLPLQTFMQRIVDYDLGYILR